MLLSPGAVQMAKLVTWKAAKECFNVLEVVRIVMQQCFAAEVVKVKHHLAHLERPPSKPVAHARCTTYKQRLLELHLIIHPAAHRRFKGLSIDLPSVSMCSARLSPRRC